MAEDKSFREMEKLSEQVGTLKELKVLNTHQQFVYNAMIIKKLKKVPSDIRQDTVKELEHYNKIWQNMITYLWRKHLENNLILNYLKANGSEEILDKIGEAEAEILEAYHEEGGE